MKNIVHPHIISLDKEELVKFQLFYILYGYDLNNTELLTLSYVFLHKGEAAEKLAADKNKKVGSIDNIVSKFRTRGWIQGKMENTSLHPEIKPFVGDLNYTLKLQLNVELD